jgi:hypothetical protein
MIDLDVAKGSGRFRVGGLFEVEGFGSLAGAPTTLNDAIAALVLAPAGVGRR